MKFPEKLWNIVNECTNGAIGWGKDGTTVFVDMVKFEKEFLGENSAFFKTKNFVSFVRQLNLYGFRKCGKTNDVHEFKSKYFIREREDLIKLMKRNLKHKCESCVYERIFKPKMNKGTNSKKQNDEEEEDSPMDTSSSVSMEYNQSLNVIKENIKSVPYSWWRKPSYLGNFMNQMNEQLVSTKNYPNSDGSNAFQGRDDISQALDNPAVYRNIVFVPVPAYYAVPSGYFGSNVAPRFIYPKKEETTASMVSYEDEKI